MCVMCICKLEARFQRFYTLLLVQCTAYPYKAYLQPGLHIHISQRDWFSNETVQCVTRKITGKASKTAEIFCICFKFGKLPVGQTQMTTLKTTAKYSHFS